MSRPNHHIFLKPRPYASRGGLFELVPLLPDPPFKHIPSEIWTQIFHFVAAQECGQKQIWVLVRLCRDFKSLALPIAYERVHMHEIHQLRKFYDCLQTADSKWDSLRRVPFSTPGRWVRDLDLQALKFKDYEQALTVDSLITALFPLVPFLTHFTMNPEFIMSCRAIMSLADRAGTTSLRSLRGLTYVPCPTLHGQEEAMIRLLRTCDSLEELELKGQNHLDAFDVLALEHEDEMDGLHLPSIRTLTLSSIHHSPLLDALNKTALPALTTLTITPYDDIPNSPVSTFIALHGATLRSLFLFTPKCWPTRLHPTPTTILQTSPGLEHLSLEFPVPELILEDKHPLQTLSVPRPTADTWDVIVRLLPRLPKLRVVRARDVRWLRKGMNSRAQETGVQGTMRDWQAKLARKGVKMLDADWKDIE
ncbi:hypothetical protein CYLTODRAFT_365538 [Cylindrobasidium torrendii FP15055 ss-10]|uniref:F-box domain-containing protein n=1 Tax=Cylindrobasidium torrendii FP15055 ss-10 TaxID=1314674 RepID=A0A0D7BV63_9AGAR|nr:hypothetical protein CYLTODRAFT_365538 [Cylindrobasidium torrendii FP15055 ss-10]